MVVMGRLGLLMKPATRRCGSWVVSSMARTRLKTGEALRKDLTVSELCDLYMAQPIIITRKGTAKKASSLATDRSNIERHIKVLLGSRRVRTLSRDDVEQFQKDVAAGKTKADIKTRKQGRAVVKGGKGTAARSVAVLGAIMTFAVSKCLGRQSGDGRGLVQEQPSGALSPGRWLRFGRRRASAV